MSKRSTFSFRHAATLAALFLVACGQEEKPESSPPAQETQQTLQSRLSSASNGDVIDIAAGRYELDSELSLAVDGVTLRGAGMNNTVLSFKAQTQGTAGVFINARDVTIEDFAIEGAPGAALKIDAGKNVAVRRLRAEWKSSPKTRKGTYGIDALRVKNLLIEECVALGASAAGIHLAGVENAVLNNNRVEFNVAALALENSIGVDVYANTFLKNSIGIAVFNLPGDTIQGHNTRIYDNKVYANNMDNFGSAGTIMATLAAGSGIVVNASDKVEIFDNYIADNKTANIIIASYFTAPYFNDQNTVTQGFDPYPESILIRSNKFSGGGEAPDNLEWETLREEHFGTNGTLSDIVWDGYVNPAISGKAAATNRICIDNTQASFINIDAANDYKKANKSLRPHQCLLPKLPAVELPDAS